MHNPFQVSECSEGETPSLGLRIESDKRMPHTIFTYGLGKGSEWLEALQWTASKKNGQDTKEKCIPDKHLGLGLQF